MFLPKLTELLGLTNYNAFGHPGYSVAVNSASVGSLTTVLAPVISLSPDVVIIGAGTNDWLYSSPIGTIDATDTAYFYGAYNYIINQLLSNIVNVRIQLWTPIQRLDSNSNYRSQNLYVSAIKNLIRKYNLSLVDQFNESGIRYQNITPFTRDGTHPNAAGGDLMGIAAAPKLLAI
jgi:lysophospholipase L1-like esterase